MERYKIGAAIQYFRESYNISQAKLCKGLCSIATLSRIESGDRDVDSLLLETLLERLGKTPNMFELILTDLDYELFQKREELKKHIQDGNHAIAYKLLKEYEAIAASKGSVHRQFITYCKALLNEISNGPFDLTIGLLLESIICTVPDFQTSFIKEYNLSLSELNIVLSIIQHMITAGMLDRAKEILNQVVEYFHNQFPEEDNYRLYYVKIVTIASRLYLQEGEYIQALDMCNKGLEKNKGSRKLDQLEILIYLKAQIMEKLLQSDVNMGISREDCINLYLQSYYLYNFLDDNNTANQIKQHLREEYQWEDTD